jgi:hypothetical protein
MLRTPPRTAGGFSGRSRTPPSRHREAPSAGHASLRPDLAPRRPAPSPAAINRTFDAATKDWDNLTKEGYTRGVRAARKRADLGPLTLEDVRRAGRSHIEDGIWAMEETEASPHLGRAKREEVNQRFWSLWSAQHGTDTPASGGAPAQPRSSRQRRAIAPTLVGPRDPTLPPAPLFLVDGLGHSPSTRPPRSPTAQRPSLASAVKRASRADRQAATSPPVEHFDGPAGFSRSFATEVPDGFAQAGKPQQPAPPLSVEDYTTDGFLDGFVEQCVTRPHERALLRACLVDLGLDCKERFDEVPYDRATLESLVSAEVNRYTAVQVSKRLFGAPTPLGARGGTERPGESTCDPRTARRSFPTVCRRGPGDHSPCCSSSRRKLGWLSS